MVNITTKDHLVYFMQNGSLKLGSYDLKFIQNIFYIITNNNPLTTNQVNLFEKLITKYAKQLKRHGLTIDKLNSLKWKATIIESDTQYTDAYISVIDSKIIFKAPFSKKFLEKFRKKDTNTFVWLKEEKKYVSPFSAHALKLLVETSIASYSNIHYCDITKKLLEKIELYKNVKIWDPTLTVIGDRLIIAAINEPLFEAIKNLPLNTDTKTLLALSRHGVNIDIPEVKNDPFQQFLSSYHTEFDYVNHELLIRYIKEVDCDGVVFLTTGILIQHKKILQQKLLDNNIIMVNSEKTLKDNNLQNLILISGNHGKPSMLDYGWLNRNRQRIIKIIKLKDSSVVQL